MGFRSLRVINDDRVEPGRGFPTHGHRHMEILSYVLEGELAHQDSMGSGTVIRPGEVQRMSAGTGVMHSEYNHSRTDPLHFLQIWIEPTGSSAPSYEQKAFSREERLGRFRALASPDGRAGSLTIGARAIVHGGIFEGGRGGSLALELGRYLWLHVATGRIWMLGLELGPGDAVALSDVSQVKVDRGEDAEVLAFELV